ncbi:MAG: tRNA lysidine(34) synthetase TilS [Bacteroidales bacterium]|jgi:tRNA(Ile)-lysidine synthase|nr:tRNA lysidine(34) synthetase TilS [Bacteroidales bacterium]
MVKFQTNLNKLIRSDSRILLAVSGGVDSMVMLNMFCDFFKNELTKIAVVHCNFKLRGKDSDEDERFVKKMSKELGVKCFAKCFDVKKHEKERHISTEMAARELRYAYFGELMLNENYDFTALAHHSDDQIETFFLNLLRGSGYKGLRGMLPKNGKYIRPMLDFSRKEIENFAQKWHIQYRNDHTNFENIYQRNKIRNQLIPLLEEISPSAKKSILKTMSNLASLENGSQDMVNELLKAGFNSAQIKQIETNERSGAEFISPKCRLVINRGERLLQNIGRHNSSHKQDIAENISSSEQSTQLQFSFLTQKNIDLHQPPTIALLDNDKIKHPLSIRKTQIGDKFIPFGMQQWKRLSRFFIDEKMSKFDKEQQNLLCCGDDIIWIIGKRIDNRYSVSPETSNILKVELKS